MPFTGFIQLYNRFPYKFEFMSNGTPYTIEPHSIETATLDMALCAIKQSLYKITLDGDQRFGVVVFGDPAWNVPLLEEDLHRDDPILGNTIEFANPEEVSVVKTSMAGTTPGRRWAVDPRMSFIAGGKNG